jgi:hypothetical protein
MQQLQSCLWLLEAAVVLLPLLPPHCPCRSTAAHEPCTRAATTTIHQLLLLLLLLLLLPLELPRRWFPVGPQVEGILLYLPLSRSSSACCHMHINSLRG